MSKPNILVILLDAVRAENLSIYNYHRDTTPYLESLKDNFHVYNNAISSSHWSLPSAASLFTGTYGSTHGLVHDNDVLAPHFVTIAQFLRKNGYNTLGLCPNPYISSKTHLDRGFDYFPGRSMDQIKYNLAKILEKKESRVKDEKTGNKVNSDENRLKNTVSRAEWMIQGLMDKYANITNKTLFSTLEKIDDKPFFAYIHYDEAHTPYIMPNKYRKQYNKKGCKEPWNINQEWTKFYINNLKLSDDEFQTLENIYDGGISYLDKKIYEIYNHLEKKSLLDDTIIIITGDHGDQFGEHGLFFHLFSLYEQLINIPLIIKYPDNSGKVVNNIVQNTDIFPTLYDLLKNKDSNVYNQFEGNSLISKKIQKRNKNYAYSELLKPFGPNIMPYKNILKQYDRKLYSIRSKKHKYIYSTDGNHEFYDLENDPKELNNLYRDKIPEMDESESLIKKWVYERHEEVKGGY